MKPYRKHHMSLWLVSLLLALFWVGATPAWSEPGNTQTEALERTWVKTGSDSVVLASVDDLVVPQGLDPFGVWGNFGAANPDLGFVAGYDVEKLRGSYTIYLISNADVGVYEPMVRNAATQLGNIMGIPVTVSSSRPPVAVETPGSINVLVTTDGSPCGDWDGALMGCGGRYTSRVGTGPRTLDVGYVWLPPPSLLPNSFRLETVAHELGHAFGLEHYNERYENEYQVMRFVTGAGTGTYRSGDRNGFRFLAGKQTTPPPTNIPPVTPAPSNVDVAVLKTAHQDLLGIPISSAVQQELLDVIKTPGKTRKDAVIALTHHQVWLNHMINTIYDEALGRDADPSGANYWAGLLRQGVSSPNIAANIWGSAERVRTAGSAEIWVTQMYQNLLQRQPDSAGLTYWTQQSAKVGFPTVAYAFYQSQEKRIARVNELYRILLGRDADRTGANYWAERIRTENDLALVTHLIMSPEYTQKALNLYP